MTRSATPGLALLVLFPAVALAQSGIEGRLREALRTSAAQLRQLEEENARLAAEKAARAGELDVLRAELEAARAELATEKRKRRAQRCTARPGTEDGDAATAAPDAGPSLADAVRQCQADRAAEEGKARADLDVARATAERTRKELDACVVKNEKLGTLARTLLDKVSRVQGDVILGLGQVQRENQAQDLEDRILELEVKP